MNSHVFLINTLESATGTAVVLTIQVKSGISSTTTPLR